MASTLGIPCGGSNCATAKNGTFLRRCGLTLAPPCSVAISDCSRSTSRKGRIYAVTAAVAPTATTATAARGLENRKNYRSGGASDAIEAQERLDEWMRESVVEIVKNLKEAPLLVQVYTKNENGKGETSTSTEKKVVVEDWPEVKERWEAGKTPLPEGVIFVEEIGREESPENGGAGDGERGERTTRVWGIVVQGKGAGCGPVCYLLKTCRVGSGPGSGLGICSTHFCLVRVKSFRETVQSQFKNCWLLQSQLQ